MANKEKNPLSNLSQERRLQMIDDHYRTEYLIRGIRLAIANGLNVSILDQITDVSKDGKTGTITKKSINNFLKEYVENCVPTYTDYYYILETVDGLDYLVSDEQLDVGKRNIRNFDICGDKVIGITRLKEYIRCFTCAYIIKCIIGRNINASDILAEYNNNYKPNEWAKENADWVIDCDNDRISFQMEKAHLMRQDLQFNQFLNAFDEQCSRSDANERDIFNFQFIKMDAPFKTWGDESLKVVFSSYPIMPSLIRECMIKGIENYCFNNELSLYFVGNSKTTTPNDQYDEVIKELRKAMENILTIREKLDGENNG